MDDPIAVTRQRMVDALRALVADVGPAGQAYEERLSRGQGFDVNRYFSVLPHLSMEPGYVLGYAYHSNLVPHIYARKWDEPQCLSLDEIRRGRGERSDTEHLLAYAHGAFDYHYHILVDDAEDGFFQLVLLVVMGAQFALFWHALYNDTAIVCTHAGLEAELARGNGLGNPIPSYVLDQATGLDLAPTVEMGDDEVLVRVAQFTKWGGLSRKTYRIQREFPHKFLAMRGQMLVEYDCGTRW
jgi:hypothetical protein